MADFASFSELLGNDPILRHFDFIPREKKKRSFTRYLGDSPKPGEQ